VAVADTTPRGRSSTDVEVKANGIELHVKFDKDRDGEIILRRKASTESLTVVVPPVASGTTKPAAASSKAAEEAASVSGEGWDLISSASTGHDFPGWKAVCEVDLQNEADQTWRYYTVLRHPIGVKKGIFAGPHPAAFRKILEGSGKTQLFGSGIDVSRHPGLMAAKQHWALKEPRAPPIFFVMT
jgi:hypothetical protein